MRCVLKGVDLLGFGIHAGEKSDADRHRPKRIVTAKVGKPPVNLLGFGVKAGQGSEAELNQPRRSVTAKVGKPTGNARNRACDEASKRSR